MHDRIKYLIPAALFLCAASVLYSAGMMYNLFIPTVCRRIYVPLAFWSIVIFYAILVHLLFFGKASGFPKTLKLALVFGFLTHIYLMLIDLVISLARGHPFLSEYYFWYIELVLLAFTFAISFASALLIKRSGDEPPAEKGYRTVFFMPLFVFLPFLIFSTIAHFNRTLLIALAAVYLLPYILMRGGALPFLWERTKAAAAFAWKDGHFIAAIFILSFVIRCFFAVNIIGKTESASSNRFTIASDDGYNYDVHALEIVKDPEGTIGKKITIWGGFFDEAYSIFLAGIYKVFGRNFYIVTLIQSFLGALLPVIVFLLGRLVFSKGAAGLAAMALALKNPIIFLSVVLGHEAVWLPFLALFILALSVYYKGGRRKYAAAAAAGLALGVVCVFRGLYLALVPITILWILLLWREKALSGRVLAVAILSISLSAVICPVSIAFKSPVKTGSKDRFTVLWKEQNLRDNFKNLGNKRLVEIGVDFSRGIPEALRKIAADPARFFSVAAQIYPMRIFGYLEVYQFGFFDPLYLLNYAKKPNNFMPTLEFYFTVFFLCGLGLCLKKPDIMKSPVFLILFFHIAIFAILLAHMGPRYKDVSTPFIYLIGAYGLAGIWRYIAYERK